MARLKKPGKADLEWMTVVCTPEATAVSFHEFLSEDGENGAAREAAGEALRAPRTSAYIGRVELQDSSPRAARDDLMLVPFKLTIAMQQRLAARGVRGRAAVIEYLSKVLESSIDHLCGDMDGNSVCLLDAGHEEMIPGPPTQHSDGRRTWRGRK